MFLKRKFSPKLAISFFVLSLSACTPTLNWREVRLESADGSALKAALPCKPDQATRKQQLADIQVELSMIGCSANEVTFTVSRIPLTNPLDASKVLAAWQAAAVSNAKAKPATMFAATVSGASAWPAATRVALDGVATQAHMLWFTKQTATGITLHQAALYGKQPSSEAISTLFESLVLE